jgi:serine phosphatase RsbU (regulator of sigma subunit)
MLTVLGHSALEDLAKTNTEITPSKIIDELNKVFQLTFSSNPDFLEYGVDLTAISIKDGSNEVLYSGVGNGLYLHTKKGIRFCPVTPKSLGSDLMADDIKDQKISVEKGDQLFLFTDGYIDQFKGNTKEIIKFNSNQFEKLLVDVSSKKAFNSIETVLEKTFNDWKADREQVDDVCVAGIKI